jgi:hypothetical protein
VDHGFEAEIDFARADDLGDILGRSQFSSGQRKGGGKYAGVVGLEERDFDAFVLEVALALGKVKRGMVRGSVPVWHQPCFM